MLDEKPVLPQNRPISRSAFLPGRVLLQHRDRRLRSAFKARPDPPDPFFLYLAPLPHFPLQAPPDIAR
jgi:hypothetical protein